VANDDHLRQVADQIQVALNVSAYQVPLPLGGKG
jgi:hypothetical protein